MKNVRSGFMLVLVPVVLMVALAVVLVFNYLTRTQYRRGHSYHVGQQAQYVAEGAVTMARCWLMSPAGRPALQELSRKLVGDLAARPCGSAAGVDCEVPVELPNLRILTAGLAEGTVSVKIRAISLGPFADGAVNEVTARLEIIGECAGPQVVRRVREAYPARVVCSLPPVLSRFALLVRRAGAAARSVNCLEYDSERGTFKDVASGRRTLPLVVYPSPPGGEGTARARDERGRPLPTATQELAAPRVARAGLVHLGGPEPWFLQLAMGSGAVSPLEEHMLLRRVAYVLPASTLGAGFQEKVYRFGFARGARSLSMLGRPGARWTSPATGEPIGDATAWIHLSGDGDAASSSAVLGPVFRRYLAFSKVRRGTSGSFRSFVHAADASAFSRVGGSFESLTGQGYEAYRQVMARVVEEPYNRSFDYLSTSEESGGAGGRVSAGTTPAVPPSLLAAAALRGVLEPLDGESDFLYPGPAAGPAAPTPVRIAVGGCALFTGDPGDLDGYEDLMLARTTRFFPAPGEPPDASFHDTFLKAGPGLSQLDLGGHVVRTKQGNLTLPAVHVACGGTLVVDGDVTLQGGVETEPGEALTIVSLRGGIRLLSSEPVHACLVALRGQVRPPPRGGLDVRGSVVCGDLDNYSEWLANAGPKRIVYEPEWNPGSGRPFARFYRLVVTGGPERFLQRS